LIPPPIKQIKKKKKRNTGAQFTAVEFSVVHAYKHEALEISITSEVSLAAQFVFLS
jgi:hypothetical protein